LAAAIGSAGFFGGNVKASYSVPNFYDVFDVEQCKVTQPAVAEAIAEAVATLS
jgi:hypothetical protein